MICLSGADHWQGGQNDSVGLDPKQEKPQKTRFCAERMLNEEAVSQQLDSLFPVRLRQ